MRIRIACCSLIYRKILRLKVSSLSQTSNGQIINLLSNDVNRFDFVFVFLYYILISPIQLIIVSYFLWENVQFSCLCGITVIALMTLPVQGYLGKLFGMLRKKTAKLTDKRVLLMNEIISGIQVIKMYAWEKPFENYVRNARINEIKKIKYSNYLNAYNLASMNYTERIAIYTTAVTYALFGNVVTPEKLFSLYQYFTIIMGSMAFYYPQAISMGSETLVTIKRIQNFLLLEEKLASNTSTNSQKNGEINIKNYNACWTNDKETLSDVTIHIKARELCTIVGPVGSGKSSFLNAILMEISKNSGKINVNGTIAYSSQDPWLFGGSIRQNILFGSVYDEKKYKEVIKVCSLAQDFQQLTYGDETLVSDKGASLSGGQRARINLARAIYRDADIYLLDDPLSAVDVNVGKHIFHECIEKYLKGKTRILVTHQIQHLQNVNYIVVLKNGKVEAAGTYNDLLAKNLEFTQHLRKKIETDQNTELESKDNSKNGKSLDVVPLMENKKCLEIEEVETGSYNLKQFVKYFKAAGNKCELILLFLLLIGNQICNNTMDYWFSYWTNSEEVRANTNIDYSIIIIDNNNLTNSNHTKYDLQESSLVGLMNQTNIMYILTLILCLVITTSLLKCIYFYKLCMQASINLHNKMFHSLSKAPMRFFDKNPIGRILNRFTKDIGAVDDQLPKTMTQGFQIFTTTIGAVSLISIVNPLLLIPTGILLLCFMKIQSIYLATAQDLKRLEGITRSPVFSHTSSSLTGLVTLRSCQMEKVLEKEFDRHQDLHTSAWYLTVVCKTSFGLWVDLLCVIYVSLITSSFTVIGNSCFTGSEVGLALSQSLILLNMVQYGMKQVVETICQMTSVERILQYTNIETEGPFETTNDILPPLWPNDGAIHFKNVFMKYDTDQPSILKNLNLEIQSGEKIGVVGRTGAGKSSLISSLFRLSIIDGDIIIDDVNIQLIGLKDLRSSISIIPQQPVLFSATMRFNLDPFEKFDDHTLWNVLEDVKLKHCITSLDFEIQSGGTNFSIGQRQLICLARAILKQNKILVLDEATANVDPLTDALIQRTIREKFQACTVITIAHRLNTIMDSDKVLVMDAGQMVEFDHPCKLLQNENGFFYKLVQETGISLLDYFEHKIV
ncbi:ATP-binding cassette sub-family C member 4-like [Chrysoperla carnea]|uniref:ATP-binding cassette sub-family C member 4-like n=1 Tax=Chrysoperla carnea TaxID=189513 RepID=UPI001D07F62E|nr:ATP-binding cassette sub-family C member 4-like [Chrysoperla carnea]